MTTSRRPHREFGAWLRSRRLARRWTQEELARRLDYDVTYVRKIEWGERRPSEALRVRLAQVLSVPVSSLPPSLPVRPAARLPEVTGPLIGRARELAAVTALFDRGERLVTLVGPPGIGKTRLAVALAARFDDRLPGGARFVPLLDVPARSDLARAVAQSLGIGFAGSDGPTLVDSLRGQEMLLVLDNFEHVVDGAPLVEEILAQVPDLRVLATSREALDLRRENQYPLLPLAVPEPRDEAPERLADVEAAALFVARAEKVRPDFTLDEENAHAVAEVCRRLQGIPLAIELAAGTAKFLTPGALLAQLGEGLDLPVYGPRDAPAQQRTLRAAIDWSFRLLDSDERVVLRRLAVFAGGCTLEAVAAVCVLPGEEGLDPRKALLALAAKSLLEPVSGRAARTRFVPLESVRAFALERLVSAGELDRIQARHAAWLVELAETNEPRLTGPDQASALAVLQDELANLTAALRWAAEHDANTAVRLCARLWRFWWIRGHLSEGRQWLDRALVDGQDDPALYALVLTGAGVLARAQGDYDAARELLERAAVVCRAADDERGLALSLINLGNVALDRGCHERASALFEEANALYEAVGDDRGVGHTLNGLGTVSLGQGELAAAAGLFERAASIFRELDDNWSVAVVLGNLGWVAHKRGQGEVAHRMYEKALAMHRDLGDVGNVATMLLNLGIATEGTDRGETVAGLFEEALLTYFRLGERRGVAECLEGLARVRADGDARRATVLLGAASALRERIGVPPSPDDTVAHTALLERMRAEIGERSFDAAWQEGRMSTPDEVVAVAVAKPAPGTAPADD